jgi:hypothetical protein
MANEPPKSDRAVYVASAIEAWKNQADASKSLSSHPNYPGYVRPIDTEDEDWRELFEWAWRRRHNRPDDCHAEVLRPRDATDIISPHCAVVRTGRHVQQLVAKRTRKASSALGRVGVIEIYRSALEGSSASNLKITCTDLAKYVSHRSKIDPESCRKFLGRLNSGHYVVEREVENIASYLGLFFDELVFQFGIYETTARQRGPTTKRRRKYVKESAEASDNRLRKTLKKYSVQLSPLAPNDDGAERLFAAARKTNSEKIFKIEICAERRDYILDGRDVVTEFSEMLTAHSTASAPQHRLIQRWKNLERAGLGPVIA